MKGRDQEALTTLAYIRNLDVDNERVKLEFLEIKADAVFEQETAAERFPQYATRPLMMQFARMGSLFTSWPMFRRTAIACLMMFFQQMSGTSSPLLAIYLV
jgi:hypothetical protein